MPSLAWHAHAILAVLPRKALRVLHARRFAPAEPPREQAAQHPETRTNLPEEIRFPKRCRGVRVRAPPGKAGARCAGAESKRRGPARRGEAGRTRDGALPAPPTYF